MDTELIRIFVKIVQQGSFSKASEVLHMPKSTISKAISRLEKETATRILVRTTRSLTLTAAGKSLFESSAGAIQSIEDAYKRLQGQDSLLSGSIRITAPEDLGSTIVAQAIGKLIQKYPDLSFELQHTDKIIDLVKDGFDIAIRVGSVNQSGFKIKKLGEMNLIVVASPGYLKGRDVIRTPEDLSQHNCLTFVDLLVRTKWPLRSNKEKVFARINPRIVTNHMSSLLKMALDDCGVAFIPIFLCKDFLEDGKLVHVLPDWRSEGIPVSMILPVGSKSSASLKVTSQLVAQEIIQVLSRTE